jgi:hypothetical protein
MGIHATLDRIIPPIHYDHKDIAARDFLFGIIGFIGFMIIIGAVTFPLRLMLMDTPYYIRFLDLLLTAMILAFEVFLITYLWQRRRWVSIGAIIMFIVTIVCIVLHIYLLVNHNMTFLPTFNSLKENIIAHWLYG